MNHFGNTKRVNLFFTDLIKTIEKRELSFYTSKFKNLEQILNLLVDVQILRGYTWGTKKFYKVYLAFGPNKDHFVTEIIYYSRAGEKKAIRLKNILQLQERNHLNHTGFVRTRLGFISVKTCLELKTGGEMLVILA